MNKFTFKNEPYENWTKTACNIKYKGKEVGYYYKSFDTQAPFDFFMQVAKDTFDDNDNCGWKWVRIKPMSKDGLDTEKDFRQWINMAREKLAERYTLWIEGNIPLDEVYNDDEKKIRKHLDNI